MQCNGKEYPLVYTQLDLKKRLDCCNPSRRIEHVGSYRRSELDRVLYIPLDVSGKVSPKALPFLIFAVLVNVERRVRPSGPQFSVRGPQHRL